MCQYCGCRQMPLIRDYIAEHEQIVDAGDDALRALDRGDTQKARQSLSQMHQILTSHWAGEEAGVFAVMTEADASYAEYVDVLVGEPSWRRSSLPWSRGDRNRSWSFRPFGAAVRSARPTSAAVTSTQQPARSAFPACTRTSYATPQPASRSPAAPTSRWCSRCWVTLRRR